MLGFPVPDKGIFHRVWKWGADAKKAPEGADLGCQKAYSPEMGASVV